MPFDGVRRGGIDTVGMDRERSPRLDVCDHDSDQDRSTPLNDELII